MPTATSLLCPPAFPSPSSRFAPSLKPFSPSPSPSLLIPRRAKPPTAAAAAAFSPSLLFDSVSPVLSAASVLAAIVLVHESGHFLAATLQRIHVSQFSIGFGPALARFRAGAVEFSLRAFPLGGYVAFPDDDPDSGFPPDDPDLLKNRPVADRFLVVSAGVAANIAFAYLIVFAQSLSVGLPAQAPLAGVLVPEVRSGSAAARAGVAPGDVILEVPGITSAPSVADLVDIIKANPSNGVPLSIMRGRTNDRQLLKLVVIPDSSPDGTGRIGVQLSPNFTVTRKRARDLAEATVLASNEFWTLSSLVLDGLRQTLLNFSQSADKVSGPVAIIAVGAEVVRSGADGLFQFAAVINLNLAAINLLPLPALDGGSLALILLEAARGGRKIPREIEQRITSSGILLVVMLGMFLIVRDTLNLDFIREML